ncbi:flagellar hook-length control protein FliK [Rhizobium ruizarguesonis]|jgi:chemotaxis protein MotD|uniref:flagellar hook-length control protein FliK n=1 Tax=Rhizobium ruizarguesonis TaxID=2081791 RepID=UPI001032657F|nr:flagellar hook-length control protein FliK [Rhizobium ruizarguesonis]TAY77833.1 flagellar hook-length control protein FliK [Rhizobium ruizarguesonis]TAZ33336.1 flagellar hook-length control protein FliK [Rhizobium ruizarguesonis]TAZ76674.1 flagellar hook-length control protein FliK [Rhizobium ruizarguesonis]TBA03307.1 flagellar hook-length control protein FliK [Rhizobium ruizarguesonis]TBA56885.1 flagellar hook-length control protein FliK [Rhizobium ruizarguesonis]
MMDMSVSGGAPGAESAAIAKSARPAGKDDTAGQRNGFSDALAKASGSAVNDEADDAQPDQTVVADAGTDKVAGTIRSRSGAKPLIDLSDAALKAQADVQPETIVSVEKAAAKPAKAEVKVPADVALGKLDPKDRSADEIAPAAKGVKHAKGDALETDTDNTTDDEDGGISDVLGLLKQDPADGAVTLPAVAAAHQVSAKTGEAGTGDKKLDSIDVKAGDHASDALAAVSGNIESGKADDIKVPGSENAEAGDGRTFRISRADGRGVSMDVQIGTDQAGSKDGSKKADVENVSVLESRRYIGLMQNSNSAAVTAALSGDSEWARAMEPSSALSNAAEWTSTGKVVNMLKIQMNPLDLGLVTATMRLSGDALNVDLKVETGAAYRQMKEDHGKILEALRSQGYAVENVTISMAPVERSDAGNQGQASQQQSLPQQGQGGEARERHNQTAQRTDGGFNGAGEAGIEDARGGGAGSSGAGGVYL